MIIGYLVLNAYTYRVNDGQNVFMNLTTYIQSIKATIFTTICS